MRVDLMRNGLVDDLSIESADLTIERTGDARYVMRLAGVATIVVDIWTTRKQRVVARPWDDAPPWTTLTIGEAGVLESFRAQECDVHFERMDRNLYFLGVYRDEISWGLMLGAHGYLKARIVPAAAETSPP